MKYKFLQYELDTNKKELYYKKNVTVLTKGQYDLLLYLVENSGIMFTKDQLIDNVWSGRHVTENSIDQIISKLRKVLYSGKQDTYIKTVYGKGLMFVPKVSIKQTSEKQSNISKYVALLLSLMIVVSIIYTKQHDTLKIEPAKVNNIVILPMKFTDQGIPKIEQQGMNTLLSTTFALLDSDGKTLYDDSSITTQQAVEKHFKIEKNLLVISSNISKKNDVYHAVIKLNNGIDTIDQTLISANSLQDLVKNQISIIAGYNLNINQKDINEVIKTSPNQLYIKALGHQKVGDLDQAIDLLKQLLSEQEDHFQARLRLANLYIVQKKYEQSQAELNTLKTTSASKIIATEIALAYSKIKMANKKYDEVINDLQTFQSNHLNINAVKKSKIQLQIGTAFVDLGKGKKAMKAFKRALINIDEQRFPLLYARSYFGQGRVMITQEINEDVFALFEKARKYAILANNLHYQILSLNSLAEMYLSSYQWEKSIKAIEQLVELSELDNDSENYAKGLSSLVAILNQRGHFTRAREINNKLEVLANKTGSDNTLLIFLFYDAILAMNEFEWEHAQQQIDRNYEIALRSKDYGVLLNNAFIALELRLLKDDLDDFKELWDDRVAFINKHGFGRIQVYMDYYLARYYKQKKQTSKAIEILNQVSKQANENNDVKMLVDAQNQLAEIYLETDAKKSLDILNKLEQHNPAPNPHLEIKAKALNKLGQNIQALSVLNQAKLVYSESWTAENEALLKSLQ